MHPHLTAQLAHEHHHELLRAATDHHARPPAGRRSPRTVVGLALVRAGLRLSHPLTPVDLGVEPRLAA